MTPNGAAIRRIRELHGYSLRRLAHLVGITPGFLSRIERDKRGAGDGTLHRIAEELNAPLKAITHKETPP